MSTRCIVRVIGHFQGLVDIYHHHDGYPEGVGMDLYDKLIPMFNKVTEQINKGNKYACVTFGEVIEGILKIDSEYMLTEHTHIDIEYMYIVNLKDMKIDCLEGHYNEKDKFIVKHKYNLEAIKVELLKNEEKEQ